MGVKPWSPIQDQIEAFFPPDTHPYRVLEREISEAISPSSSILDIGCGRRAPNLERLKGKADRLIGIDLVDFPDKIDGIELINDDVAELRNIETDSVDIAYSRAVMEHVEQPQEALNAIRRVLRPGGRYIFLTPTKYDYASLLAAAVPNKWHPKIVRMVSGRAEEDVFPTHYKCNSKRDITALSTVADLHVEKFEFMGQYPPYLTFSRPLFYVGCLYEKFLEAVPALHPIRGWIFCVLTRQA